MGKIPVRVASLNINSDGPQAGKCEDITFDFIQQDSADVEMSIIKGTSTYRIKCHSIILRHASDVLGRLIDANKNQTATKAKESLGEGKEPLIPITLSSELDDVREAWNIVFYYIYPTIPIYGPEGMKTKPKNFLYDVMQIACNLKIARLGFEVGFEIVRRHRAAMDQLPTPVNDSRDMYDDRDYFDSPRNARSKSRFQVLNDRRGSPFTLKACDDRRATVFDWMMCAETLNVDGLFTACLEFLRCAAGRDETPARVSFLTDLEEMDIMKKLKPDSLLKTLKYML